MADLTDFRPSAAQRDPFRRYRPVWQVQLFSRGDSPVLDGYSSLLRRAAAVAEGKRVADIPNWWVRVVDVATGEVAFTNRSSVRSR
jgi:hypothetical protein